MIKNQISFQILTQDGDVRQLQHEPSAITGVDEVPEWELSLTYLE